ncbi:MAG: hypothetical protein N2038_14965 [Geminicoccaceae bacterium]|nr:hypothetical protein [Geminicoccaceae bacterium]MDW8370840.1 hypothetical protein [Geminicoccaceae bacterium]
MLKQEPDEGGGYCKLKGEVVEVVSAEMIGESIIGLAWSVDPGSDFFGVSHEPLGKVGRGAPWYDRARRCRPAIEKAIEPAGKQDPTKTKKAGRTGSCS